MKANVGYTDRRLRLILGAVLIVLPFLVGLAGAWRWGSLIVGLMLVVTAMLRTCPAYSLLGINSCPRK